MHMVATPNKKMQRVLQLSMFLTLAYVVATFIFGLRAHSLALISEAGHNLSDLAAMGARPAWALLAAGSHAIVDPSLLATLDARIGDSLTLGYARFAIVGTIRTVPGDAGLSAAIGPRVFINERDLAATRLLVFGSRADYKTLVVVPRRGPNPPQRASNR